MILPAEGEFSLLKSILNCATRKEVIFLIKFCSGRRECDGAEMKLFLLWKMGMKARPRYTQRTFNERPPPAVVLFNDDKFFTTRCSAEGRIILFVKTKRIRCDVASRCDSIHSTVNLST